MASNNIHVVIDDDESIETRSRLSTSNMSMSIQSPPRKLSSMAPTPSASGFAALKKKTPIKKKCKKYVNTFKLEFETEFQTD